MERRDLYEDDLTDERGPTPAQRDDTARTQVLDPDVLDNGSKASNVDDVGDDDDEDDDLDDDEDDDEEAGVDDV